MLYTLHLLDYDLILWKKEEKRVDPDKPLRVFQRNTLNDETNKLSLLRLSLE